MNSDSAFYIGSTHDICQDFTLSGHMYKNKKDILYSIVADGCSSSPYSSLGSRILSFSAQKELNNICQNESNLFDFQDAVCIERARTSIESLGVSSECLDSTLITTYSTKRKTSINIRGDGVIAIGLKDGTILVISVDYPSGYPYYMNYLPSYNKRYKLWNRTYIEHSHKIQASIINANGEYRILKENYNIPYSYIKMENPFEDVEFKSLQIGGEICFYIGEKDKYIVSMSDGIKSFYKFVENGTSRVNQPIDYHEVIYQILNFKSFNGQFMQRRLNKFLKQCTKLGWHHYDDIAFGAIHLEE